MKSKFNRITLILIVLSFTISLLYPIAAYAAPSTKADEEAQSFIWYKALEKCFADGVSLDDNTLENISSYKWFTSTPVAIGYLNTGDGSGTANCNDAGLVQRAVNFWGYGNPVNAWCKIMRDAGPHRLDGSDCISGTGNFTTDKVGVDRATAFKHAVELDYYNTEGGQPQISDQAKYYMYYASFTGLCGAKPVVKASEANDTQKAIANSDKGYQIRFVNSSNQVEDWIYQSDKSKGTQVGIFEGQDQGGYPPCSQLAEWIGQNADQFAKYAQRTNFKAPTPDTTVPSDGSNGSTGGGGTTTCGIKTAIGWILCPVTQFLAVMLDKMYEFIASKFLVVPSQLFDTSNGTYKAWKIFRDYANVAFIIAFLIIVYSQVTSVGISNYGIKKMLPKLIIAAILVNISFYICQGLVELMNMLGYGIKSMFDGVSGTVAGQTIHSGDADTGAGGTTAGILLTALAGVSVVVIAVALGLIVPAIIAVGIAFLILLIRQAIIVILIVVSPLAFVAWLLPNTENLFKQWWGMLLKTLLVFPIVAFIFGGARLASIVITSSGSDNITQLIGVAAATLPLALVLPALNNALKAIPIIGKKLQTMGDKATGKIGKKASKRAGEMRSGVGKTLGRRTNLVRSRLAGAGGVVGYVAGRKSRRDFRNKSMETDTARNFEEAQLNDIQNHPGRYSDRQRDEASAVIARRRKEEIATRSDEINRASIDLDGTRALALGANSATGATGTVTGGAGSLTQHAAIQKTVSSGDVQGIRDLVNNAHTMDAQTRKVLADSLEASSNRPAFVGAGAIGAIRQGTQQDSQALVRSAINQGTYSTEKLAKADRDEVAMVADAINDHATGTATLDASAVSQVKQDAARAVSDRRFGAGKNRANLGNVGTNTRGVYS